MIIEIFLVFAIDKKSKTLNERITIMNTEFFAENYKFVAIVNKNIEMGVALNALAHACAGLVASASEEDRQAMSFIDFVDKSQSSHKSISALSLIVLRGESKDIRKVRRQFTEKNIHFVDFTKTMTGDTYAEQLIKTADQETEELEYYCIVGFGKKDEIGPMTKRYSLWK